jgi:hypothetical protein
VGKTRLVIALGMATIAQAVSVYFITVIDLLDAIQRDAMENRLGHRLRTLCKPRLLNMEEMGYFPLDRMAVQSLSAGQSTVPEMEYYLDQQQNPTATGATAFPIRCWRWPSWADCCITQSPSTSGDQVTDCVKSARPASSPN